MDIYIKITKWEEYNPRKDIKNPAWFCFQNNLFEDPSFYSFSPEEFIAWAYLLCQKSRQRQREYIAVSYEHFHRGTRASITAFKSAIKKLQKERIVQVRTYGGRYGSVRDPSLTRQDSTIQDTQDSTHKTDKTINLAPTLPRVARSGRTIPTWEAYREAFKTRYGEAPVRNAKMNALLGQLMDRIGAEEAPQVAGFFLTHNDAFYVRSMHPVSLLVRDAEKIRTEWATGRKMTHTRAAQIDRTQNNFDAWDEAREMINAKASQ